MISNLIAKAVQAKSFRSAASWLALLLLVGCGGGGGDVAKVHGLVSYKGKPVVSGGIFFSQPGQRPIGGAIGSDGSYSQELPPGDYQVRIDAPAPLPPNHQDGDPIPEAPRLAPESFANFATSGLSLSVPAAGGDLQQDFALK